jgi:predicted nucleic acid-binding protein
MATTVADLAGLPARAMLDANVLVAATDPSRPEHHDALRIMTDWPRLGVGLCTSTQILREYLSVATRPYEHNGLGLPLIEATGNVRIFQRQTTVLADGANVVRRLLTLLDDVVCAGKQIHDANVVATMLAHDVHEVVTMNPTHFARFEAYVNLIGI